jgi:hypothetical protein
MRMGGATILHHRRPLAVVAAGDLTNPIARVAGALGDRTPREQRGAYNAPPQRYIPGWYALTDADPRGKESLSSP